MSRNSISIGKGSTKPLLRDNTVDKYPQAHHTRMSTHLKIGLPVEVGGRNVAKAVGICGWQ